MFYFCFLFDSLRVFKNRITCGLSNKIYKIIRFVNKVTGIELEFVLAWLNFDCYFHVILHWWFFAQFFLTYNCYLLDVYAFSFVFTNNELVIDSSLLGRIDLSHFLSLEWSVTSGSNSSCYKTLSQFSFGVYVHQTHHYILCQKNYFDWLCNFYVRVE